MLVLSGVLWVLLTGERRKEGAREKGEKEKTSRNKIREDWNRRMVSCQRERQNTRETANVERGGCGWLGGYGRPLPPPPPPLAFLLSLASSFLSIIFMHSTIEANSFPVRPYSLFKGDESWTGETLSL